MGYETPISEGDAKLLRYLKTLVTALTVTMVAGVIVLIGVVVMRFDQFAPADAPLALPNQITLPSGAQATAFTRGPDWLAIVTDDGRILIYGLDGTTLRQEITID